MSLSQKIKVYAVILNYNSSLETLALYKELVNYSGDLEVLVIDNNSNGFNRKLLDENIPKDQLILNKRNIGYAAGNNIGIDTALKANADYIWILNPDIRVNKDALSILVETMQGDETLAAVGPRIIQRENPGKIFSDGEKMFMDEKASTVHKNHNLNVEDLTTGIDYDIDYIAGSSNLLNSQAIRELGKLPEDYFLYFEETDWCFKARKNNWKLAINTNSEVFNLTSKKGSVFHYYFSRNKLIFCKKYHPDYKAVRNQMARDLLYELSLRLRGKYLRPYFSSRLKGYIVGFLKTIF